jgi:cobaltochelatase CobS
MQPQVKSIVDGMLNQAGVNLTLDKIMEEMTAKVSVVAEFADFKLKAEEEITSLRKAASKASAMPSTIDLVNSGVGGIPDGKMEMVDAGKIFPMLKANGKLMIPKFTWDSFHPDVPTVNPKYVFRKGMLINALRCLVGAENAWFVGHTGSGKTTIVEQIAAMLGWPVARVAFDSNVDRSELVGRMSLKGDGKGGTVSEWMPGILERATSMGYILLCDEIDAGHPNALYTLQPVLEGKPLTLLEDGGRVVPRHPMCRVFATGNTTGNGDPSGLYPACRILSAATLDRFPNFVNVPYMSQDEEVQLIKDEVPGLANELVQRLAKFATEMRAAFVSNQTPVSYSPRRSVAFAREVDFYYEMGFKDEAKILSTAFKSKLYDAASEEFRQRITEIANASLGKIDPTKTVV